MTLIEQIKAVFELRDFLYKGLGISLLIAFSAVVMGFVIGVIMAMIKISPKNNIVMKVLDKFADLYITIIRGTPMLVQLLIMSGVILVSFEFAPTNIIVPIVAFGINSGAYMAEIIRSGISSVDKGQMEAGRSLGLSWTTTMFKIIIPQAIKVVVPTIFNEIISLVKETSVVAYIALRINGQQVWDLLGYAENMGLYNAPIYMALIFTVALIFLAVVMILTLIQKLIERSLSKNER